MAIGTILLLRERPSFILLLLVTHGVAHNCDIFSELHNLILHHEGTD